MQMKFHLVLGRNSEAYCEICASDEGSGMRFAIAPYVLWLIGLTR